MDKVKVYTEPLVTVVEVRTRAILAASIKATDCLKMGGSVGEDPGDPFDAGSRRTIRQPDAWQEW